MLIIPYICNLSIGGERKEKVDEKSGKAKKFVILPIEKGNILKGFFVFIKEKQKNKWAK